MLKSGLTSICTFFFVICDHYRKSLKLWPLSEDSKQQIFLLVNGNFRAQEEQECYIRVKLPLVPADWDGIS